MGGWPGIVIVSVLLLAGCTGTQYGRVDDPLHPGGLGLAGGQTDKCPERPVGLADDAQAVTGTVEVLVRLWAHRVGEEPVPGEDVAAVRPGSRTISTSDLRPSFSDCVLAAARTGNLGTAVLHLIPGTAFSAVSTHGSFNVAGNLKTGLQAAAGQTVDLLLWDATSAPRNACGLPERPFGVPLQDDTQYGADLVDVRIELKGPRPGDPGPSYKVVAAVATSVRQVNSTFDLEPFFEDCSFASASTSSGGSVVLHLARGQAFMAGAEPLVYGTPRATLGPFEAQPGLAVAIPWFDPVGLPVKECDRPRVPFGLDDDVAFAADLVDVEFHIADDRTGTGLENVQVHAYDAKRTAPFEWIPGFSRSDTCDLAFGKTDRAGNLHLFLPAGVAVDVAVYPGAFSTAGGVVLDWTATAGVKAIPVLPSRETIELQGTIQLPGDRVAVPVTLRPDPEANDAALARLAGADEVHVQWTNSPLSWADLWADMAVGGGEPFTDDFFNEPQGPLDGEVEESVFGASLYGHECDARQHGLRLDVYSPPEYVVTVDPLPYTIRLEVEYDPPMDFEDPFRVAC